MIIVVFVAKKNHRYPTLDMEDTQGLTTDIFDMECAKHAVNQYEPELAMPEVESYDKESFDKLLSAQCTCYCQKERGRSMVQLLAENMTKTVVLLDIQMPIHC